MTKKKSPGSVLNVESIKIGGLDWQFHPLKKEDEHRENLHGQSTTPSDHTIRVRAQNSLDPRGEHLDTVFHEILHAICCMIFVPKNHLREHQVHLLAEELENIFVENPKFVKWVAEYSDWIRQERKKK